MANSEFNTNDSKTWIVYYFIIHKNFNAILWYSHLLNFKNYKFLNLLCIKNLFLFLFVNSWFRSLFSSFLCFLWEY
jgi:hypothetical protein